MSWFSSRPATSAAPTTNTAAAPAPPSVSQSGSSSSSPSSNAEAIAPSSNSSHPPIESNHNPYFDPTKSSIGNYNPPTLHTYSNPQSQSQSFHTNPNQVVANSSNEAFHQTAPINGTGTGNTNENRNGRTIVSDASSSSLLARRKSFSSQPFTVPSIQPNLSSFSSSSSSSSALAYSSTVSPSLYNSSDQLPLQSPIASPTDQQFIEEQIQNQTQNKHIKPAKRSAEPLDQAFSNPRGSITTKIDFQIESDVSLHPSYSSSSEFLTCYTFPSTVSLSSSFPLPLGILYSPYVHLLPSPPLIDLKGNVPPQCSECKTFINLYCKMNENGEGWRCCMCEHENGWKKGEGMSQEMQSKVYEFIDQNHHSGSSASLYAAAYAPSPIPSPFTSSNVSGSSSSSSYPSRPPSPSHTFSASSSTTIRYSPAPYLTTYRSADYGRLYCFLVDTTFPRSSFASLRLSLAPIIRSLPNSSAIALITFDSTISIYDITIQGIAEAMVIEGGGRVEETRRQVKEMAEEREEERRAEKEKRQREHEKRIQLGGETNGGEFNDDTNEEMNEEKRFGYGFGYGEVGLHGEHVLDCLEAIEQSSVETLEQQKLNNPRCLGSTVDTAITILETAHLHHQKRTQTLASSSSSSSSSSTPASPSSSALDLDLSLSYSAHEILSAHFLVFTSGAPDYGPGACSSDSPSSSTASAAAAASFYTSLSSRAQSLSATIDIFTIGPATFSIPILRSLADPTGGSIYMEKDMTNNNFNKDLQMVIERPIGFEGESVITCSSAVNLARVIGPVVDTSGRGESKEKQKQRQRFLSTTDNVSSFPLTLSSVRPDLSLSLFLSLDSDVSSSSSSSSSSIPSCLYFQFISFHTTFRHQRIIRISTRRIGVTNNLATVVKSIDIKLIAVFIIKRLVAKAKRIQERERIKIKGIGVAEESKKNEIQEVIEDLDAQVRDLCYYFGRRSSIGSIVSYDLPHKLSSLPLLLFHCRRGPLLSSLLQHPDDISLYRSLFLYSNRSDCYRFLFPVCLSFDCFLGELIEVPMETLALQSNKILYVDTHQSILIWSGELVKGMEYDYYRQGCIQRAADQSQYRVPAPELLVFEAGSSAARWLQCRMIPTHKDSMSLQNLSFPPVQSLTQKQRQELIQQFPPTDDQSFVEYFQQLFISDN